MKGEEMSGFYDIALKAIQDLFGDTSRPKDDTIDELECLRDEIDILLEALDA